MGLLKRIQRHGLLVGLLSVGWLLLRSGSKPSRVTYPCQQAAKANAFAFLWVPLIAAVQAGDKKLDWRLLAVGLVLLLASMGAIVFLRQPEPTPSITGAPLFPLTPHWAVNPASTVYAVNGYTGTNGGLIRLIELMEENGSPFYESTAVGKNQRPAGLITADDVVIIKVNSQWSQRGGTNTDLLRELIELIQAHPDGFKGEIIVADNGQAQYGSAGRGGSLDWTESNAETHSQSVQRVVDAAGGRVSTYLWDTITSTRVEEYQQGDVGDGYVVEEGKDPESGLIVSYPKFTSKYGTKVSFKHGIWDPASKTYDSEHLKVINLPVLKTHGGYGVTGAVKSYMGVPSDKLTASLGSRTHTAIAAGAMGTLMAETRFPTLTILDCVWVNAVPRAGPSTSYTQATRVNVAAASMDPVALDVWASQNILMKAAPVGSDTFSMNPHSTNSGSFGDWLRRSAAELNAAGYPAELDENRVTVITTSVA